MDQLPPAPETAQTALGRLDGAARAEYWAALALRRTKGLGARSICRLLGCFGSAYTAVHNITRWKEAGIPPARGESLAGNAWRREARPEWEDSQDLDGHILLWTDPRYPALLRNVPDAPALLYARGDISLLQNPCVAIVGSRACSRKNLHLSHDIARDLSLCGITVASGMARGIDHAAHVGAMREKGRSIAVLGAGLDVIYPPRHKDLYHAMGETGLLLSEFPPGSQPEGPHFPIRNRIISGLSLGVLVVEAARHSGSLITARLALDQNRTVYAVPATAAGLLAPVPAPEMPELSAPPTPETAEGTDGCAILLEEGAHPVLAATDILADLFPQLLATLTPQFSNPKKPVKKGRSNKPAPFRQPEPRAMQAEQPVFAPETREGNILTILRKHGPLHAGDLLPLLPAEHEAEQEAGRLSALLLMLEVEGAVRRLPGMIYEAL